MEKNTLRFSNDPIGKSAKNLGLATLLAIELALSDLSIDWENSDVGVNKQQHYNVKVSQHALTK